MHRETSLPDEITRSSREPSNYHGFSGGEVAPKAKHSGEKPKKIQGIVTAPQHRFVSSSVNLTSKPQSILGANEIRRFLMIQNTGLNTAFLGFGVVPKANGDGAILLEPGFEISLDIVPNNEITALSTSGTTLAILEGSLK